MQQEILLIDDDPITNFLQAKIVERNFENPKVKTFENGLLALEYIKANPTHYFIIFLDLNMPVMNGWDFLEAISEEKITDNVQIHILTSSVDKSDEERARKHKYVELYLTKPLSKDILADHHHLFPVRKS